MKIRLENIRVALDDERPHKTIISGKTGISAGNLQNVRIERRSVDARDKNKICIVYTFSAEVSDTAAAKKAVHRRNVKVINPAALPPVVFGNSKAATRPVITGFGPAGMFAAYTLAKHGYRPIVIERGEDVDSRTIAVRKFWDSGCFKPGSNVQFGEGGAGTFSDGKLTCRTNDPYTAEILALLVECGAPPEILYEHKPHIGTDVLKTVVKNIRQRIISYGGEVLFGRMLEDICCKDGKLEKITVNGTEMATEALFLCIGHSARVTYRMLHSRGVRMERKPFSVGVRIEHEQALIDRAQYGKCAGHPALGAADYSLVYHDDVTGRTAYSFCMCPGGQVVAAASETGGVVVNGMSNYHRDSGIANAALVVNVNPEDCGSDVLAGIEFQQQIERAAFVAGGERYNAPFQTVGNFLTGTSCKPATMPTYRPGVTEYDLRRILPGFVSDSINNSLMSFSRKIKGYAGDGVVMTAPETRTSAPVRILRRNDGQSETIAGIYPTGEGAGYAGGIMSAACDGMRAALIYISRYRPE